MCLGCAVCAGWLRGVLLDKPSRVQPADRRAVSACSWTFPFSFFRLVSCGVRIHGVRGVLPSRPSWWMSQLMSCWSRPALRVGPGTSPYGGTSWSSEPVSWGCRARSACVGVGFAFLTVAGGPGCGRDTSTVRACVPPGERCCGSALARGLVVLLLPLLLCLCLVGPSGCLR